MFDTAIKTKMEKICNMSFGKENWSQAFLPIGHPGLAAECRPVSAMFLVIASCLQEPRQLPTHCLNPKLPHGDVNDVFVAWSEHHDSSPLQKGRQAAWDNLTCRDPHNTLLNTKSPWNYCWLLAAQKRATLLPVRSSHLPRLESCSALMSSILQLIFKPVRSF